VNAYRVVWFIMKLSCTHDGEPPTLELLPKRFYAWADVEKERAWLQAADPNGQYTVQVESNECKVCWAKIVEGGKLCEPSRDEAPTHTG